MSVFVPSLLRASFKKAGSIFSSLIVSSLGICMTQLKPKNVWDIPQCHTIFGWGKQIVTVFLFFFIFKNQSIILGQKIVTVE